MLYLAFLGNSLERSQGVRRDTAHLQKLVVEVKRTSRAHAFVGRSPEHIWPVGYAALGVTKSLAIHDSKPRVYNGTAWPDISALYIFCFWYRSEH